MPATVPDCIEYFKHLAQNAAAWVGRVPKHVDCHFGGAARAAHGTRAMRSDAA